MRIAIIGCGFVADLYMKTRALHPQLRVVGATDRNPERIDKFCSYYAVPSFASVDSLLKDSGAEIILNLTTPESHYDISKRCLLAGKHVYSEKPLALDVERGQELVDLAQQRGLLISSAPSRLLAEPAQTLWRALRQNTIGKVRLVYSEMDDGLVHRMAYKKWISVTGAPWPYKNEFETGTTLEHAGYSLTWLAAFFGPATSVSAFSSCLIPDKETDVPLDIQTPDFSVGCIRYESGVIARVTNSIVAPEDHSIRIFGDDGILRVDNCWKPRANISLQRRIKLPGRWVLAPWKRRLPLLGGKRALQRAKGLQKVDFFLGVVDLARAAQQGGRPRLSADFSLHIAETALALQYAMENSSTVSLRTRFAPIAPMPWAE